MEPSLADWAPAGTSTQATSQSATFPSRADSASQPATHNAESASPSARGRAELTEGYTAGSNAELADGCTAGSSVEKQQTPPLKLKVL